jgi:hypothetical protein
MLYRNSKFNLTVLFFLFYLKKKFINNSCCIISLYIFLWMNKEFLTVQFYDIEVLLISFGTQEASVKNIKPQTMKDLFFGCTTLRICILFISSS